jgi:hypothetical protein
MRQIKNPLILAFAIIGVCALIYFFWQGYQRRTEEEQARARMAAPPQVPGVSKLYKDAPPPPQP